MKTKNCTSVEQSRKLVELGIDVNTADLAWYESYGGHSLRFLNEEYPLEILGDEHDEVPAWSLSVLMQLLPSDFTEEGKFGTFTYEIKIRKYRFTADIDMYQIAYGNYAGTGDNWKDMINTGEHENIIDAVYDMVCWLLKNKKI